MNTEQKNVDAAKSKLSVISDIFTVMSSVIAGISWLLCQMNEISNWYDLTLGILFLVVFVLAATFVAKCAVHLWQESIKTTKYFQRFVLKAGIAIFTPLTVYVIAHCLREIYHILIAN